MNLQASPIANRDPVKTLCTGWESRADVIAEAGKHAAIVDYQFAVSLGGAFVEHRPRRREAYGICEDMLEVEFNITVDEFVGKINVFLDSNRVTTPVRLNLPSRRYPELIIEVDPRKKSVIARMANVKKRIFLNRYLTKL